jgi:hypothetical protein
MDPQHQIDDGYNLQHIYEAPHPVFWYIRSTLDLSHTKWCSLPDLVVTLLSTIVLSYQQHRFFHRVIGSIEVFIVLSAAMCDGRHTVLHVLYTDPVAKLRLIAAI